MEIQYPTVQSLEGISIFIFGSAVYKSNPNDIDILFLYNDNLVGAKKLSAFVQNYCIEMEEKNMIHIHRTVLSIEEEKTIRFIEKIGSNLLPII